MRDGGGTEGGGQRDGTEGSEGGTEGGTELLMDGRREGKWRDGGGTEEDRNGRTTANTCNAFEIAIAQLPPL
ncbi:hypothetical protein DPMN_138482 [Dreissena polymorpha]|uniref:Uncharacterized protein n=1 Tax=Dreissena polymorpha TaxID=45954 RepID=A0A9D4JEQ1_DREPO|nr:hypothetical protein DPMN_138482 [Dreissena polymorpha]